MQTTATAIHTDREERDRTRTETRCEEKDSNLTCMHRRRCRHGGQQQQQQQRQSEARAVNNSGCSSNSGRAEWRTAAASTPRHPPHLALTFHWSVWARLDMATPTHALEPFSELAVSLLRPEKNAQTHRLNKDARIQGYFFLSLFANDNLTIYTLFIPAGKFKLQFDLNLH